MQCPSDGCIINRDTKLAPLIRQRMDLTFVLNLFSIPLGLGDKTIQEVCDKYNIDCPNFITLLHLQCQPDLADRNQLEQLDASTILSYLKESHNYFLNYRLPSIRQKFAAALPEGNTRETILSYFKEYEKEVNEHMHYEDEVFFPYVAQLISGNKQAHYSVKDFEARHDNIEEKLEDLISLILKYLPIRGDAFLLSDVLDELQTCDRDLNLHTFLEDKVLVPKIEKIEQTHTVIEPVKESKSSSENDELSDREKEIVCGVAKGMSNKEIADELFISIHTVITHRRNISRKLSIHSTAGLTVYAILNNLIDIETLRP
ncbi:MAG: helix-turn-helix transcriptional regulator [Bacteroidales bacterium]|nr:helix-turn-helix transcriptional regulator [Bacteroidales bacterium]